MMFDTKESNRKLNDNDWSDIENMLRDKASGIIG